jgi:hypothetical protein
LGLISKTALVKWHPTNQKWYISKGYNFTKMGDEFEVDVNNLNKGTVTFIEVQCDCCKQIKKILWQNYLKNVKEDDKYYCHICAIRLYSSKNAVTTKLNNSKSFKQWCVENNRQDLLKLWDYDLNNSSPDEVGYGSKYKKWFKCPRGIHESELKIIYKLTTYKYDKLCSKCNSFAQWGIDNISNDFLKKYWDWERNMVDPWKINYGSIDSIFIRCQEKDYHGSYNTDANSFRRGCRCPYCSTRHGKVHRFDSLGKLLEDNGLLNLWSERNKISPYECTQKNDKEVWWKCSDDKHEDFKRSIYNSNKSDFRCPKCQYSKGEKRIEEWLTNKIIEKIPQKEFNGLIGLRGGLLSYDFYLPRYNLLIEYQGEQHERFIRGFHKSKKDFERQQEHDVRKRKYAKEHNIRLLEIWYWDYDNIEDILKKELIHNELSISA